MISIGYAGIYSRGFESRYTEHQLRLFKKVDASIHKSYFLAQQAQRVSDGTLFNAHRKINGRYEEVNSDFKSNNKPKLLIIGDSFAQDFLNSAKENSYLTKFEIRLVDVSPTCQVYLGDNDNKFIPIQSHLFCKKSKNRLKSIEKLLSKADVIVIAANWREWAAVSIKDTINKLSLKDNQSIIVLGSKDLGVVDKLKIIQAKDNEAIQFSSQIDKKVIHINQILKRELPQNIFIDQQELLCKSNSKCHVFTDNQDLISFDGTHLTKAGAKHVGEILFKHPALISLR